MKSDTSLSSKSQRVTDPFPRLIVDTAVISLLNTKVAVILLDVTLLSSAAVKLKPSTVPIEFSAKAKRTSLGLITTLLRPYVAVIDKPTVFPNGTVIVSLSKVSLSGITT